jgi:hypothetical protein
MALYIYIMAAQSNRDNRRRSALFSSVHGFIHTLSDSAKAQTRPSDSRPGGP